MLKLKDHLKHLNLNLLYVHDGFPGMYARALCVCLVPIEAKRRHQTDPVSLELQIVVSRHMGAGNPT